MASRTKKATVRSTTTKRRSAAKGRAERTAAKKGAPSARKHEVKADLSNFELAKAKSSLNLKIFANDEKLGELEIGRGSLFWYGRNRHRSKRINWSRFAEMMDELAYGKRE